MIELAKCPHCGGKFDPGSDFCIYCGFGLIYKDDKEGIKEKPINLSIVKEGRLIHLAHERGYWGCPICLKKDLKDCLRCVHDDEPVKLFWRKYVARDSNYDKFVVECSPRIEELLSGKDYRFHGVLYSENDRFIVSKVEELEKVGK